MVSNNRTIQPNCLILANLNVRALAGTARAITYLSDTTSVKTMNATPNTEPEAEVGKANFDSQVLRSERPVLVVFWAPWSMACRVAEPVLNEVMRELSRVRFVKINADDNPHLSLWYGVQSLPTLLYFINGDVCARIVGTASKEAVLSQLEASTGNDGAIPISRSSNERQ